MRCSESRPSRPGARQGAGARACECHARPPCLRCGSSTGNAYVNGGWKHVTMAFNGSAGIKIYIDNVYDSALTFDLTTLPLPPSREQGMLMV
mmetsp:Transcript_35351/g.80796  ORF Transcript_35351/g.80796 Transcript_35351/m.80796 type:complete len:92 (+) Transcript_35351:5511-5786(+)